MKPSLCAIILVNAATTFIAISYPAALAQQQPTAVQAKVQVQENEVLLDMVVHDRSNKPVLDLQPDQIIVTDNGQEVKLEQLRLVNADKQSEPLITLLFNRPGVDPKQKGADKAAQDASRRLNDAATRFLRQLPDAGFQFSVMDVWGRLQLQQEISSDHKATEQAVAAAVQPGQFGVAVGITPAEENLAKETGASSASVNPLARSFSAAVMESSRLVAQQQASAGLASLQALVEAERGLTGRKAIVYFADTTELVGDPKSQSPTDAAKTKSEIQAILGAANRAGVSIYVVRMDQPSMNGPGAGATLDAYAATSAGATESGPTGGKSGASSSSNGFSSAVSGQFSGSSEFAFLNSKESDATPAPGTLDSLVRGTGGFSFRADDAFPPPVKQLVSDLTTYYEASYALPGNIDGSFHAVAVRPIRGGLKVRGTSGYVASPLK